MIIKKNINTYRNVIAANIGKEVSLTLKSGRKYVTLNDCVIENAYNAIFVVKIKGESLINCSKISVCYADLLTGNARVTLHSNSKGA